MLERLFAISDNGTSVRTECLAGLSTFLTMSYIILVNPLIMSQAGIDLGSAFVATCIVAALGSCLVGLLANYPIAAAPAMGINAYFTYAVVQGLGYSWQLALGAIFISSLIFFIFSITPLRAMVIAAIPESLALAVTAGLGLFLAMLALKGGGCIVANKSTFMALGNLHSGEPVLFLLGFCLIIALEYHEVPGSIVIGIVVSTLAGFIFHLSKFHGLVALPPSLAPAFNKMQLVQLQTHKGISVVAALLLVAMFDSTGTFVGILHQPGVFQDPNKQMKKLPRALGAVSITSMLGAVLGTSAISPYCESATGVKAGGRTGLTSVVVGGFFVLMLFFSPLAKSIPSYAASTALLYVGCLMLRSLAHIEWTDMSDSVPAAITAIAMPFTFSIADGIGIGLITYVLIKVMCGRWCDIKPLVLLWALIFAAFFAVH